MVVKCRNNYFDIIINFKEAFNQTVLEEYYIEECFDKYSFVVADLSDNKIRLKGFNASNDEYKSFLDKYLLNSCTFECPYYLLKHIEEKEYLERKDEKNIPLEGSIKSSFKIEKENFDRDTLILEKSFKEVPKINLDMNRINSVKIGSLPENILTNNEGEEKVTTTISGSEGFVPIKKPQKQNKDKFRKTK